MASISTKQRIQFMCDDCGSVFPAWQGQCSACGGWNSLKEQVTTKPSAPSSKQPQHRLSSDEAIPIVNIPVLDEDFMSTGVHELDRVLGRGFVRGSVCLLGGEPGIGKSTLALQTAQHMAKEGKRVLYVSGEESASQLRLRSERVGENHENLLVFTEVDMLRIVKEIATKKPDFVVLDSIQVVVHTEVASVAGTVAQVRMCANELIGVVKQQQCCALIIGHITKEGTLAGPKVLEHLVDVILYFEGERNHYYRLLRCFKNRFASTQEIGVFDMKETGLREVANPSELFLDDATLNHSGSMVVPIAEGERIFLVELQALVVNSGYGMAKRTFLGVDPNRANLMIAALEKIMGVPMASKDIILNVVGGLRVGETALDLGMVLSIITSLNDVVINRRVAVLGEVGLTGEIRGVSRVEKRLQELVQMGFEVCILPEKNKGSAQHIEGIDCLFVSSIRDAIRVLMSLKQ